jgi:hypothetical protein
MTTKWPGHRLAISLFAVILVVWVGIMAVLMRASALPNEAKGTVLVAFPPGTDSEAAFAAITKAGGRPIRETAFGFIWVVHGEDANFVGALKQNGALGAYVELPISATIAGCFAAADAAVADAFGI